MYFDPASPKLASLPQGWPQRLIALERVGITAHFLDPNDAAISKLARGEPRDWRWARAGIRAGLMSKPMLLLRLPQTDFLGAQESLATQQRVAQL